MNIMDETISKESAGDFARILGGYMQANHRHDLGSAGIALWFTAFIGQCTLNEFAGALATYAATGTGGKRPPQPLPSDIIGILRPEIGSRAAWQKVLYCVRHYGANYTMNFDDLKIALAVDKMGGWPEFCSKLDLSNNYAMNEANKEFQLLYAQARIPDNRDELPVLKGAMGDRSRIVSIQTDGHKYLVSQEKPKLIGKN